MKQSLTVTPILYFADGTPFPLAPVALDPAGVAQVNIRVALQSVPASLQSHLSNYGMAGISYQWSWAAVIATIQNIDEVASLTTTSSFQSEVRKVHATPEASNAQAIRGQWWLPTANADGYVALENTSLTPKQASVQFLGRKGNALATQQVALASHATALIKLSGVLASAQSTETFGGVEIDYTGPDHGVLAYSGIEDPTVGYSASPLLFESHLDPARPVHQVTLSAPGLKLGSPDPVMLFPAESYFTPYAYLHNVSANPLQVTLSLVSAGSGGPPQTFALGQVSLQPGETSHFDIASQFSSANPMPDGNAHLTASFQGRDGDLELAAGSVDQTQTYVFEVNPSQQADSASRTICFWSVEGDNDSTITIWNYKAAAQDLVLTLYYFQGQYAVPFHLGPNESYTLDMASLVHSRAPDPSGTVIPANIVMGSAMLAGKGGETDTISVAVSASVFNVRNATCGPVCTTCNGATQAGFNPSTFNLIVLGNQQADAQVTWNSGGTYTNPAGITFTSGSSSVFTVDPTGGSMTGEAPGIAAIEFADNNYPIYNLDCSNYVPCPYADIAGGAPVTVPDMTPVITGIAPGVWDSSPSNPVTTPDVAFYGQYFGTNAPTLNFSDPTISYTLLSYNDTQIVANVTVATGTPNEDVAVTVTNNGYGGSAFAPGGTGNSATSDPSQASVQALMNFPDVTVIGWINGSQITLPTGANSNLVAALNNSSSTQKACFGLETSWLAGQPVYINNAADAAYANAWLLKYGANNTPPDTITPSNYGGLTGIAYLTTYRLFNDYGGTSPEGASVGWTPDPCGFGPPVPGQAQDNNGATGTSKLGYAYQLAEGRVGSFGQQIYATINNKQAVPYIWSVVEFNAQGTSVNLSNPANYQIFPTYYVYINGVLQPQYTVTQTSVSTITQPSYQGSELLPAKIQ